MPVFQPKVTFEIEHNRGMNRLPTCFPAGYDRSNLVEVATRCGDWATFYNMETKELVHCEDFYKQLTKEREKLYGS